MVVARKRQGSPTNITWSCGTVGNLVPCVQDDKFMFEDEVFDPCQKPSKLYKNLIETFTKPNQWVLDVCTGTGTGLIQALDSKRNVISLDNDARVLEVLQLRLGRDLVEKELESEEEMEEEEDDIRVSLGSDEEDQ